MVKRLFDINKNKSNHYTKFKITKGMGLGAIALSLILISPLIYAGKSNAQEAGTTFPPPLYGSIRSQPAYEISIPFSTLGKSPFVPQEISIPTGITVIWFNNDDGLHTVS